MGAETLAKCPACGTTWQDNLTCQDYFHQMLFWEAENPAYGVVHHLTVLCYHLQHPQLYSPQGLRAALALLVSFVVGGEDPEHVRRRQRARVDSSRRDWKITATAEASGSYPRPVHWTLTAGEVVAAGAERYIESVKAWARGVYADLETAGVIPVVE